MPAALCGRFFYALPADKVSVLAIRSHRVRRVFAMRSSSGSWWPRRDAHIAMASRSTEEKMDDAIDLGQRFSDGSTSGSRIVGRALGARRADFSPAGGRRRI